MDLPINEIKIRRRFRQKLTKIKSVEDSIKEIGLLHPVVINEKNELISGRRRIEAFRNLGRKSIPISRINITNLLLGEFHENEIREDYVMTELVAIKREIEKTKQPGRPSKKGTKLAPFPKGKSVDLTAKVSRKSKGTIQKMEIIVDNNDQKIIDAVESGNRSVDYAYNQIITEKASKIPTPNLPKGEFEIIFPDFPWDYQLKLIGSPKYKTMTLEEIKKEYPKLPTYKDCVLIMWATAPKLLDALALIDFYGFTYKSHLIWVKTKEKRKWEEDEIIDTKVQSGTGYYVKGSHELLLIAIKGSPRAPPASKRFPSVVFAERSSKHSQKPRIFARLIEELYPAKKKLEMFARERDPNDDGNWTYHGDQLEHA